jgi:hypothetical protein
LKKTKEQKAKVLVLAGSSGDQFQKFSGGVAVDHYMADPGTERLLVHPYQARVIGTVFVRSKVRFQKL